LAAIKYSEETFYCFKLNLPGDSTGAFKKTILGKENKKFFIEN